MKSNRVICLYLICLTLFPLESFAESPSALVNQGNSAYDKNQYDEALKAYEAAGVDVPESPQIYYNKGAAYYRKGEYEKARESWEKAALNAKETALEARSLFNLGNAAFQEAQRQKDSDPNKAMDAYTRSIGYYQQVLDLLKSPKNSHDPVLLKDASENIEMVRLIMKSLMDDMSKQQEQNKQQQQAVEEIKELIKKQKELINRNQYYSQEKHEKGDSSQLSENIAQMAGDQDRLREETKKVAEKLASADPNIQDGSSKAKEHLSQSQLQQSAATQNMTSGELANALPHQQNAVEEMKNALELLEKNKGQGRGQDKPEEQQSQTEKSGNPSEQKQNQEQQSGDQENQAQPDQDSQQNQKTEQKQNAEKWIGNTKDDAQSILNEEKENQKNRYPESSTGYRGVDKDW